MKLAVPHHAGITLHPHVAFDAPNKPADFKLTSLNQPVNHSACAASAKATAHPLISSSFSFPLPSQSGVSDILCPPFPLSPSSLIPPHPAPSHPKEPPHTPQAALAHKASSQPGLISFHILLLLRSAILLAVLCHHPMSRHLTFHVPSILPRFLLDPRASPSACWRIY